MANWVGERVYSYIYRFSDSSTPFMRTVDNGEKKGGKGVNVKIITEIEAANVIVSLPLVPTRWS